MAAHKGPKAVHKSVLPTAVRQSKPSPRKARAKISVASLFEQKHQPRRRADSDAFDVLAPHTVGVSKDDLSSRASKKAEQNPLFKKFLGVTADYRDGSAASKGDRLEPVYNEVIARVETVAVDSVDNYNGDLQPTHRMTDLVAEHARLANPLSQDKIEIQWTKAGGSKVAEERKLSETMQAFERTLEQKRSELEQLLRELEDVDAEISATRKNILAVEHKDVKRLKHELDTHVAALLGEAEASKAATLEEIEKARKEEKRAADAQNKKFEELMKTMF